MIKRGQRDQKFKEYKSSKKYKRPKSTKGQRLKMVFSKISFKLYTLGSMISRNKCKLGVKIITLNFPSGQKS